MPSWWNSLDSVSNFNWWMQLVVTVAAFITAAAGLMTWLSSNQISTLQAVKEAELRKVAETAEQRTRPRGLTPEQASIFVEILRRRGVGVVTVSCSAEDETRAYAEQLGRAIQSAGWQAHAGGAAMVVPPVFGVVIRGVPVEHPDSRALVDALKAIGVEPKVYGTTNREHVELFVGQRPMQP